MKNAIGRLGMRTLIVSGILAISSVTARGSLITFTETGPNITGSLGSTSFTGALITITQTADTANITTTFHATSPTTYLLEASSATVTISGGSLNTPLSTTMLSTFTLASGTSVEMGQSNVLIAFAVTSTALASYNLSSAIGPAFGNYSGGTGTPGLATSDGMLNFVLGGGTSSASFTATFASSVPEPSSLMLCGIASGIGLVVALTRRQRARPTPSTIVR